ncbi:MAG: DUF3090 family protein [Anaerolineae bacterium]|jgi:uncharacterized repeat protein (TIGR03847 family)|uniref:DUF3090 family protein n=1 Tax=Candidatus Flexifilum breve TaxID=3140694 RepID=UPI001AC092FC|nr:DUF3090 family protein [Chloroflexota bacterium]MBN8635491.1 DUF3090 family protein [Anaerolineae bacterium]
MPNIEIELNPVDFITVGTIGPKGQRVFHLQAAKGTEMVSLVIEKEQAWALSEAIRELLQDLDKRYPGSSTGESVRYGMELRDPVEPLFRVAQMGLGYDEDRNMVVLVAQELVVIQDDADPDAVQPGIVRMWCSRNQMRVLSDHATSTVQSGRPDPRQNGRLVYYWT